MYWGVGKYCGACEIGLFKSRNATADFCLLLCVHRFACSVEKRQIRAETHAETERGNRSLHFRLNHIKHSVSCNAAAEASSRVWKEHAVRPQCVKAYFVKIPASQHPVLTAESRLDCSERSCCNLCREGGNHPDCCRENVLNDNLQPRACETDAEFPDKTLFFQRLPPSLLPLPGFFPFQPSISCISPHPLHNPSCRPLLPPFFLPRPWLLWKYVLLSVFWVFFFFTCSFPRLTHGALVQMNVCAQAMSTPTEEIKLSTVQAHRLLLLHKHTHTL